MNRPVLSQEVQFFCGKSQAGSPATIVRSSKHGDKTMIVWNSSHFQASGYGNQRRCNDVTQKFQNFYNQGTLKYLVNGTSNGQAIICAIPNKKTACNDETQLYTLKTRGEATVKLKQLQSIRSGASGRPMYESNARVYIDFNEYLNRDEATASLEPKLPAVEASNTNNVENDNSLF
ncbi:MAG: COP23 domain-containing protein [Cyanobacteria bacterium J06600_6]